MSVCKDCIKKDRNTDERKETRRKYRLENKERFSVYAKEYKAIPKNRKRFNKKRRLNRKNNLIKTREKKNIYFTHKYRTDLTFKEKTKKDAHEYYLRNREKCLQYRKDYKQRTKKQRNLYEINRKKDSPNYKLLCNLRTRLSDAIQGKQKSKKTLELLGCSVDFLKKHLESKFTEGMNWNNYGRFGWHIDHIKPCILFDLSKESEQQICFHYSNLQPLWWHDNLKKNRFYKLALSK